MNTGKIPMRLPPLQRIRVKNSKQAEQKPCVGVMSSVLSCWASAGYNTAGCAAFEQALRECMDAPRPPAPHRDTINYHLSRMQEQVGSKKKKKGFRA